MGKGAFLYKAAEEAAETLGLDFNIRDEQNASNLIHLDYSLLKARIKKAQEKNFREQLHDKWIARHLQQKCGGSVDVV